MELDIVEFEPNIEHLLNNSEPATAINTMNQQQGIVSLEFAANAGSEKRQKLPKGFTWSSVNLEDTEQIVQFLEFINENGSLPGQPNQLGIYTQVHLQWMNPFCLLTVRSSNDKIVGSIGLFPIVYAIDNFAIDTYYTDLLFIHPKMQGKALEKVMVREAMRRAGVKMNGMIVTNTFKVDRTYSIVTPQGYRWMTRPLNIDKLASTVFRGKSKDEIMLLRKMYDLKPTKQIELFQRLAPDHIPVVFVQYQRDVQEKHLRLRRAVNMENFAELYLPHDNVYSYVLQNASGEIKDFVSFYTIYGSNGFKYAYLTYITYPNDAILLILLQNTLYICKRLNVDFFFVLDIAGLSNVLSTLKFKHTDTKCYYSLVNYRSINTIDASTCSLVLP